MTPRDGDEVTDRSDAKVGIRNENQRRRHELGDRREIGCWIVVDPEDVRSEREPAVPMHHQRVAISVGLSETAQRRSAALTDPVVDGHPGPEHCCDMRSKHPRLQIRNMSLGERRGEDDVSCGECLARVHRAADPPIAPAA